MILKRAILHLMSHFLVYFKYILMLIIWRFYWIYRIFTYNKVFPHCYYFNIRKRSECFLHHCILLVIDCNNLVLQCLSWSDDL